MRASASRGKTRPSVIRDFTAAERMRSRRSRFTQGPTVPPRDPGTTARQGTWVGVFTRVPRVGRIGGESLVTAHQACHHAAAAGRLWRGGAPPGWPEQGPDPGEAGQPEILSTAAWTSSPCPPAPRSPESTGRCLGLHAFGSGEGSAPDGRNPSIQRRVAPFGTWCLLDSETTGRTAPASASLGASFWPLLRPPRGTGSTPTSWSSAE